MHGYDEGIFERYEHGDVKAGESSLLALSATLRMREDDERNLPN